MNTKTIIRIATILGLGMVGLYGILSEPQATSNVRWFIDLLWSKALGIAAIYAVVRLYNRWCSIDSFFASYDAMCKKCNEAPNPMHKDNH